MRMRVYRQTCVPKNDDELMEEDENKPPMEVNNEENQTLAPIHGQQTHHGHHHHHHHRHNHHFQQRRHARRANRNRRLVIRRLRAIPSPWSIDWMNGIKHTFKYLGDNNKKMCNGMDIFGISNFKAQLNTRKMSIHPLNQSHPSSSIPTFFHHFYALQIRPISSNVKSHPSMLLLLISSSSIKFPPSNIPPF